MKRYFDKSPFLYVASSFLVFLSIHSLISLFGSLVSGSPERAFIDFRRILPIVLVTVSTYLMMSVSHNLRVYDSFEQKAKLSRTGGILVLAFAGSALLHPLAGFILQLDFKELVSIGPSIFYPLDIMLLSVLEIVVGICWLVYAKNWKEKEKKAEEERDRILFSTGRLPVEAKRIMYNQTEKQTIGPHFLTVLFVLISMYGFAAACFAPFTLSWTRDNYVFFNLTLMFLFFLPSVYVAVWKFFFLTKTGKKRVSFKIEAGAMGFCFCLISVVFYLAAIKNDPTAAVVSAMSLLPIDFYSGFNIVWILYGAAILLPPAIFFGTGIHEYGQMK